MQNIRPVTTADFDLIYHLYMHPQTNPYLLYEWMEKEQFKPIFEELLAKGIVYVYEEAGKTVGMFKLAPWGYRTDHIVYLGGLAIHPDCFGQGYGMKMTQAILDFAKSLGYLRVELSTAVTNEKAIRLYEKAGFEKEGVLRRYTHLKSEGVFLDEVMMSYLF